jgi:uncharacterized damage-inducible protein DinB
LDTRAYMSPNEFLEHWLGHRRLTRRVIEAFPEDQLFSFTLAGMRPFGEMVMEMIRVSAPTVRGVAEDVWESSRDRSVRPKQEVLRLWDESTDEIDRLWKTIEPERFHRKMVAFGQWPGIAFELILYAYDNEHHHRGQGYVYLRALAIEPPAFWER